MTIDELRIKIVSERKKCEEERTSVEGTATEVLYDSLVRVYSDVLKWLNEDVQDEDDQKNH